MRIEERTYRSHPRAGSWLNLDLLSLTDVRRRVFDSFHLAESFQIFQMASSQIFGQIIVRKYLDGQKTFTFVITKLIGQDFWSSHSYTSFFLSKTTATLWNNKIFSVEVVTVNCGESTMRESLSVTTSRDKWWPALSCLLLNIHISASLQQNISLQFWDITVKNIEYEILDNILNISFLLHLTRDQGLPSLEIASHS